MKITVSGFAAWSVAGLVLCGCGTPASEQASAPPPAAPSAVVSAVEARRREEAPFPLPVIELVGSPEQMGTAHGRRLGEIIRNLHHDYLNAYFTNPGRRMMAMAAAAAFEQRVSPPHLAEVNALASESGVEARQMLLAQCFLDLSPM